MDRNLPATRQDPAAEEPGPREQPVPRQRVSVAFLPLALVTFIILAFSIAAWTFLSAAL